MAGFRRKRKIYKLDFTGTDYDGLEVRVGSLTTGEFLELIQVSAPSQDNAAGNNETERMLQFLAKHIISWNLLDEEGQAVPTTFEGLLTSDLDLNQIIIGAWVDAIGGASGPLEKNSTSGESMLVESIPMTALSSESLGS